MADIKQAAKWIDEGHDVQREIRRGQKIIRKGTYSGILRWADTSESAFFMAEDLLAEDWEIAD